LNTKASLRCSEAPMTGAEAALRCRDPLLPTGEGFLAA
jgi:hypothetical protein